MSLRGQRYVDPVPLDAGPAVDPRAARRSRTMAVLALIIGLAAVSTAWMPFFVVIGVIGAIIALTLGIVAVRRISAGTAEGRGLAISGIVLGVVALALTPIGVILTRSTYDELVRFAQPGRATTTIDRCAVEDGKLVVEGTLGNREADERNYVLDIAVTAPRTEVEHFHLSVDDVAAGTTRPWSLSVTTSISDPTCRLAQLTGPYPFGLDPAG